MKSYFILMLWFCMSETVLRLETDELVLLGTTTLLNCTTDGESFQKVTITIKKDPNLTVFTCPTYNTCVTNFPGYFYKESLSTPNKIVVGITAVTMDDIAWTCQYEFENAPKAQKNLTIADPETVLRLETDELVLLGTTTLLNCTTDGESFQKVTITIKKDPNLTVFTCPTYNTCVTNFPGYFYKESLSTPNKIVVGITAVTMDDIAWTCQYEFENAPKAQKNLTISDPETVLRLETDELVLLGTTTLLNCTTDGESFQKVTITIKKDPNLTVFTCPTYNTCVTNFPGYFYKESLSTPNKIVVGITAVTMDDIAWTCQYEFENAPKAQKNLTISDPGTSGGYCIQAGSLHLMAWLGYFFNLATSP